MEKLNIIGFEERYHEDFKRLSYEWLEKYVSVESEDERILNNPIEVILDKGGHIFFARYDNEIVGTVSLIRVEEGVFELAKLAVTEKYKGMKIGIKLMEKCLEVSKSEKVNKIILYTSHKLGAAINLYKKFGFKEIPIIDNKYIESDIKMELDIYRNIMDNKYQD